MPSEPCQCPIQAPFAVIQAEVSSLNHRTTALETAVNGNGNPGIKSKIERMEEKLDNDIRARRDFEASMLHEMSVLKKWAATVLLSIVGAFGALIIGKLF